MKTTQLRMFVLVLFESESEGDANQHQKHEYGATGSESTHGIHVKTPTRGTLTEMDQLLIRPQSAKLANYEVFYVSKDSLFKEISEKYNFEMLISS